MTKFCEKCNGTGYLRLADDTVQSCSCRLEMQNHAIWQQKYAEANLPNYPEWTLDQYVGADVQRNVRKLRLFVDKFDERFKCESMYWVGTNSTQKTTSAVWVARELLKTKHTVQYVSMQQLVQDLVQGEFEKGKRDSTIDLKKYSNADFLVIDESFDNTKLTVYKSGYQIPFLDTFLRDRIEFRRRSTLFISNVSADKIDAFSPSLRALVERCTLGSVFTFEDKFVKDIATIKNLWEE